MSLKPMSSGGTIPKKRHGFLRLITTLAVIIMAAFVIMSVTSSGMKLKEYEQEYEQLVNETAAVKDSNEEIRRFLEEDADMSGYIENKAREKLDFARQDERVYYIVPDSGE